jgi:hypothetical protein
MTTFPNTSHRQLKLLYAGTDDAREVKLDRFRIDAIRDGELIEVQLGSLAALRDKSRTLLAAGHSLRIVKPLIAEKQLISLDDKGGNVVSMRRSPKRQAAVDLFHELVHFMKIFPHRNLELEIPLIEIEERRYPGHGKRRRWRKNDFIVEDQQLVKVRDVFCLSKPADLWNLLPDLPTQSFSTGELAEQLQIRRWVAQRVAYCLRESGAVTVTGKTGNAFVYRLAKKSRKKTSRVASASG